MAPFIFFGGLTCSLYNLIMHLKKKEHDEKMIRLNAAIATTSFMLVKITSNPHQKFD